MPSKAFWFAAPLALLPLASILPANADSPPLTIKGAQDQPATLKWSRGNDFDTARFVMPLTIDVNVFPSGVTNASLVALTVPPLVRPLSPTDRTDVVNLPSAGKWERACTAEKLSVMLGGNGSIDKRLRTVTVKPTCTFTVGGGGVWGAGWDPASLSVDPASSVCGGPIQVKLRLRNDGPMPFVGVQVRVKEKIAKRDGVKYVSDYVSVSSLNTPFPGAILPDATGESIVTINPAHRLLGAFVARKKIFGAWAWAKPNGALGTPPMTSRDEYDVEFPAIVGKIYPGHFWIDRACTFETTLSR